MKRSAGVRSTVLLIMAALAVQNAKAGSAVSTDGHGHLVYSYGHLKEIDEQNVLELGRLRYGPNVRILAASNVAGYGAIAVARTGTGWVAGVALGHSTRAEAEQLAIERCLKRGGSNPRIKWEFRG